MVLFKPPGIFCRYITRMNNLMQLGKGDNFNNMRDFVDCFDKLLLKMTFLHGKNSTDHWMMG